MVDTHSEIYPHFIQQRVDTHSEIDHILLKKKKKDNLCQVSRVLGIKLATEISH